MTKIIEAEYLADQRVLKLAQPLAGVGDHERVVVTIETLPADSRDDWPTLSEQAGRELAAAVRDGFGRDDIAV